MCLTCGRGVKADDERLSGENLCFLGAISLQFRMLIVIFDLQQVVPGDDDTQNVTVTSRLTVMKRM